MQVDKCDKQAVDLQAPARQPRRNANPHNANRHNWQQCGLVNAGRTTPAKSGRKHLLPSGARSPMRLGISSPRRSGMPGLLLTNAPAVVWQATHTRWTSQCVLTCAVLRPMRSMLASTLPSQTQISTSRLRERASFLLQHVHSANCYALSLNDVRDNSDEMFVQEEHVNFQHLTG